MSKKILNKKGLAPPQIALAALIIIAILGVGWLVNNNYSSKGSNNKTPSTANAPATASSAKSLEFKEYGVKINLPADLNGLKYSVSTPPASANAPNIVLVKLNMDEYTKLANKCMGTPTGTEQSFATLIKTPQLGNTPPSVPALKQFGDFYIGNLGPALQNPTCKDGATQKSLSDLSKKLDTALKTAFDSAQKV
jgi:hypothetical protein